MKPRYDVIVVGAGPAGSVAARRAAEAGLETLLIEKRQEIGAPVRCAEAIGAELAGQFIAADPRWIDARIRYFAIHSAHGEAVKLPPAEPTLVVNRKVFDVELAHLAAHAGAEVLTRTMAVGVMKAGDQVCGVRIRQMGVETEVAARLVVAADGAESQVARWAGLKTASPLADYYIGIEYYLDGVAGRIDPEGCEYHLDSSLAPGGYLWAFPKGEGRANVGLVISADRARDVRAIELLRRFVSCRYPDAGVLATIAGGIPVTGGLNQTVMGGLVVVGDAAHQADPLTAGGICLGMVGADLAMQVAIEAVKAGDVSAGRLAEVDHLWQQRFGRMHAALYKIRKMITCWEQAKIDELVATAASLPLEQMSLGKVMLSLFRKHPGLLLEARTLIATGLIMK